MNASQAVSICLRRYADFTGRAVRPEYWWWALFAAGLVVIAAAFDTLTRTAVWGTVVTLALLVPSLAVGVRRLRDSGLAWPWLLVGLIPLVGWIWLIVLLARPSLPRSTVLAP